MHISHRFKRIPFKAGLPCRVSSGDAPGAVYIGMGVNIGTHGQRMRLLTAAVDKINQFPATRVLAVSSIYLTPPWGVKEQEPFYNGALAIRTALAPGALLHALKSLERALGRKHRERWGPREIDLDILVAGSLRLSTDRLIIPHPQFMNRAFAMVPVAEINQYAALPKGKRLRLKAE